MSYFKFVVLLFFWGSLGIPVGEVICGGKFGVYPLIG
jgi:hypothetical protein